MSAREEGRAGRDPKRSLDVLVVDDPCTLEWDTMLGSGAVRYCRLCRQNVYDLSDMSRAEAEEIAFAEEDVCIRFYRRADGTVVTKDCAPTRVERARRASRRALGAVGTVFALGLGALALLPTAGAWGKGKLTGAPTPSAGKVPTSPPPEGESPPHVQEPSADAPRERDWVPEPTVPMHPPSPRDGVTVMGRRAPRHRPRVSSPAARHPNPHDP